MKQRILSHTSFIIVLTVLLTFGAACGVMYNKVNSNMKDGVRNEAGIHIVRDQSFWQ